jgi:hypothetical protein
MSGRRNGGVYETVPSKLDLSESNTTAGVIISCGPKLDVLGVRRSTKPWFGGFIETISDVIEIINKSRVVEQFCGQIRMGDKSRD